MIASATFYLAFTRKIYVARATRCHICPKMTVCIANTNTGHFIRALCPVSQHVDLPGPILCSILRVEGAHELV